MRIQNIFALSVITVLASACDWVDGTGRSGNSAPVTNISFADGQRTGASELNEQSSLILSVNANDSDGSVNQFEWQENPVSEGRLSQCDGVPGFNNNQSVDSLSEACSSDANCRVVIRQQVTDGDVVDFLVTAPKLRANVGVEYELTAIDNEGGTGRQRSTFCLVAINEAPDAVEDSFTVLEGETLVVNTDGVNLLTNDTDDEHIGNQGWLQVLTTPRIQPSLARSLTLGEDGGFIYAASLLPSSGAEVAIDTFVYTVSDGSQQSDATVTIRVLARNNPPELLSDIPLQSVVAGVPFESDLSTFFDDSEGAVLSFSLADGALPSSGGLTLSADGVLSGTAQTIDIGSYTIEMIASDGSEIISSTVTIDVESNLPVESIAIVAQTAEIGEAFTLDVSDSFDDPENQALTYSLDTEFDAADLSMNARTGVLSGEFEESGRFTMDVSASDGVTASTSIRFVVNVTSDNVAPVFRGTIRDQLVDFGDAITPIAGTFVDANSDDLEFSVLGTLPAGVTLSDAGVLSGRPTESGEFTGLRIVATDPLNEFARSNAFTIVVVAPAVAPANSSPVFSDPGSVFNQGISLGFRITPIEPIFTDPDGDSLSYRVIGGTLPDGVVINSSTGVITGTPTELGWERGLIVIATDPSGASATSDEFWIRVR